MESWNCSFGGGLAFYRHCSKHLFESKGASWNSGILVLEAASGFILLPPKTFLRIRTGILESSNSCFGGGFALSKFLLKA